MRFANIVNRLINRDKQSHYDDFYKSRVYFTFEACIGSTIYSLTTGAFMAGFASMLGASDSFNGLLAVIPMMAGMIQLFAPLILERYSKRKPVIILFSLIYKFLISSIVFLPLLVTGTTLRLVLLFISVVIAYSSLNMVWPGFASWLTNVVPDNIKGRYFSIKDTYALVVNTTISLIMGFVLDSYKKPGAIYPDYAGFVIVFSLALALAVINALIFFKIKDVPVASSADGVKLLDCIIKPLKNKVYMKVVVFTVLWNIGLNIGVPFLAVYQVKYLRLEYKYIMFLTLLNNVAMAVALRFWGRYADRLSWVHSAMASIGVLSVTHFLWGLIFDRTLFLLPVVFILGGIAWGGINISLFNLPFLFAPEENKTIYLGFNAAFGGFSGLAGTLAAGGIVSQLEGRIFNFGQIDISNIQIVVIISSVILLMCVLYAKMQLKKLVDAKET